MSFISYSSPEQNLMLKQHYMHGSLSFMKYKTRIKLSLVKKTYHNSNYKNVCKTVAEKHQFGLCHQMQSDPHYFAYP